MARRKHVEIFKYQCPITEQWFKTTKKAKSADDLISVEGYYQMNPEEDDRPEHIKRQVAQTTTTIDDAPSESEGEETEA